MISCYFCSRHLSLCKTMCLAWKIFCGMKWGANLEGLPRAVLQSQVVQTLHSAPTGSDCFLERVVMCAARPVDGC